MKKTHLHEDTAKIQTSEYKDKIHDSLYWWLNKRRDFIINDEYSLKLLFIDFDNESVKIEVTNLKNQDSVIHEITGEKSHDC